MRFSPTVFTLAIALHIVCPSAAQEPADALATARVQARHELELAKLELRLYHQVEYPRERRHLDAQIELTKAEVDAYKERVREYRSFERFSTGRPLLLPTQDLRLCLLEAELRLKDLLAERNALVRFHADRWRMLELKMEIARRRLAELEGEAEIILETAAVPGR